MTAMRGVSFGDKSNALLLLTALHAKNTQNSVVLEFFLKKLKLFEMNESGVVRVPQKEILDVVLSTSSRDEKFQRVKAILEKSLGFTFLKKIIEDGSVLMEDALCSRAAIRTIPRYDEGLPVTATSFHQLAVRSELPSDIAELYQYRTKIGDTIYHFWADTHCNSAWDKAVVDHFKKPSEKKRNAFIEGSYLGLGEIEGVNPIEPDQRYYLIGAFVMIFHSLECRKEDVAVNAQGFFRLLFSNEDLITKSVFNTDKWKKYEKGALHPFAIKIGEIVLNKSSLVNKAELLKAAVPKEKFSSFLWACATMLAEDKSVPEEARQKLREFRENYKNLNFDANNWNLGKEITELRDLGMATQMYNKRKEGIQSFGYLGYKHLFGVIKHLRRLHAEENTEASDGKVKKAAEGKEKEKPILAAVNNKKNNVKKTAGEA